MDIGHLDMNGALAGLEEDAVRPIPGEYARARQSLCRLSTQAANYVRVVTADRPIVQRRAGIHRPGNRSVRYSDSGARSGSVAVLHFCTRLRPDGSIT